MNIRFIDGYCSAIDLCETLGLYKDYFRINRKYNNTEVIKLSNILFVKPPKWVRKLLEQGYNGFVIKSKEDLKLCSINKFYKPTDKTKIGFWK